MTVNEALLKQIQEAITEPSTVDMKLSNGFASLMVWSDFFALTKREREFLFYLKDQMETFERDSLVIEPVATGSDAPPVVDGRPGAAPDPEVGDQVALHDENPDGPIEDAVFPTTEQIRNQRKTGDWNDSGSPPSYGPIEHHRLPDPDVVEKIREHLREPGDAIIYTKDEGLPRWEEPADHILFPPPDVPSPTRAKNGRRPRVKETCPECGFETPAQGMENHRRSRHPSVTEYPKARDSSLTACPTCDKLFETTAEGRHHDRTEHGMSHLSCIHSWLLGAPIGLIVTGTCKYCSAVKDFPSSKEPMPLSLDKGKRRNA